MSSYASLVSFRLISTEFNHTTQGPTKIFKAKSFGQTALLRIQIKLKTQ